MPDGASTAHLYRPKLASVLREGYGARHLRTDAAAGLTVAVVALPLSMAIAMASGVSPERGLYTAIVGGLIVFAAGGSRVQIGGPAGAFIILVAATTAKFGLQGLLTAVLLSGLMLMLLGLARIGSLVRHMPHAVTVSFTCAIAAMVASRLNPTLKVFYDRLIAKGKLPKVALVVVMRKINVMLREGQKWRRPAIA